MGADHRPAPGRARRCEIARRARRLAASRVPDLPRAGLLAMLGRFDEAWPLAEARSNHLREVTAIHLPGRLPLPRADRDDRRRPGARVPLQRDMDRRDARRQRRRRPNDCSRVNSVTSAASTRPSRSSAGSGCPAPRSGVRVMAAAVEALLLAERGDLEQAGGARAQLSPPPRPRPITVGSGWTRTRTWSRCSYVRIASTKRVKRSSARSRSGSGRAACPARNASATRSRRSDRQRA